MAADVPTIETERLRLLCWRHADRDAFAAMNADPVVMADLGGPLGRADSDRKYDHYLAVLDRFGFSRWAIEDPGGEFPGYAGVMPRRGKHPLGDHDEIGWRLVRSAWGRGWRARPPGLRWTMPFYGSVSTGFWPIPPRIIRGRRR